MKSLDEFPIQKLMCDTCCEIKPTSRIQYVLGGICVCDKCVNIILELYISSNPTKMLCPYCLGKNNINKYCNYCDLIPLSEEMNETNTI